MKDYASVIVKPVVLRSDLKHLIQRALEPDKLNVKYAILAVPPLYAFLFTRRLSSADRTGSFDCLLRKFYQASYETEFTFQDYCDALMLREEVGPFGAGERPAPSISVLAFMHIRILDYVRKNAVPLGVVIDDSRELNFGPVNSVFKNRSLAVSQASIDIVTPAILDYLCSISCELGLCRI